MNASRLLLVAAAATLFAGCGGNTNVLPPTNVQQLPQETMPLTWPTVPKPQSAPGTRQTHTWPSVPKML